MPILEEQSEVVWEEWKAQLTQNTTPGSLYPQSLQAASNQQMPFGGIGGIRGTTTTTGAILGGQYAQNVAYPVSSPSHITSMIKQVPVIDESYAEKLHFMDSKGNIHSFSVDEVYTKLGLKW